MEWGNGFPVRSFSVRSFPFLPLPSLPSCPFPSLSFPAWVSRLGLSLGTYHLAIARVAFLLMIAGIDGRAKRFFQIVFPLGIAGKSCVCRAFGHGKQKMRNYF